MEMNKDSCDFITLMKVIIPSLPFPQQAFFPHQKLGAKHWFPTFKNATNIIKRKRKRREMNKMEFQLRKHQC
jgi:hypothetical protein